MTKQELLDSAKALSDEDRLDLAMELWDSIAPGPDAFPVADDVKRELDRRLDNELRDPSPPEDWNTLKDKLLKGDI